MNTFDSWLWVAASKTNDDNTAGAKGSFSVKTAFVLYWYEGLGPDGDYYFYAWWQPIEQVFFKLGKVDEDGKYWAGSNQCAWGFQSNDLLIDQSIGPGYWNGTAGSYFGSGHGFFDAALTDHWGMQLSIIPMDMLTVNLGWVLHGSDTDWGSYVNNVTFTAKEAFVDTLAAQVVVNIPGAGTAAVGFKNGPSGAAKNIAVQYSMGIGDNMSIEVGIKTNIGPSGVKNPIHLGIGYGFGSPWGDTFWLTARLLASFATASGGAHRFGLEVCPSYDLSFARLYVPLGFGMETSGGAVGWRINPYIRKQMSGIEFWAGFQLNNGVNGGGQVVTKGTQSDIYWSVPIALLWAW
jgi:hypothetical protein